jgi:serine/threonine-protein kinase RsbW
VQTYERLADPSCLDELHAALDRLWAEAPEVDESQRIRFATALAEVVANVVEHGRTLRGGAPTLTVEVAVRPDRVRADVFDDGVAVGPRASPADVDELAEAGRGLALAGAVLDELRYVREDAGNRWVLVVRR